MAAVLRRDTLTALKQTPEYFSDFLLDFDVDRVKKDLVRNTNAEAIKASIVNLLLTNRYQHLFPPLESQKTIHIYLHKFQKFDDLNYDNK